MNNTLGPIAIAPLALPAPRTHVRLVAIDGNDPQFHSVRHEPFKTALCLFSYTTTDRLERTITGDITMAVRLPVSIGTIEDVRQRIRDLNNIAKKKGVVILNACPLGEWRTP